MANFREDLRLSEFRIVYSLWSVQRTERNSVHMANFIEPRGIMCNVYQIHG